MDFSTNTLRLSNTFNGKLQTTRITTQRIDPRTELQRLEYDYHVNAATENNGNPRKHRVVEPGVTRTQEFSFDAANRLTQMKEGLGTGTLLNQSYVFDAFGNRWVTSTTGYQRDDLALEPNVEFSGTRTMKRHFGRFWSPDENLVDQSPDDPLSWNLYAYARGNPVRYSDPTGMACVDGVDDNGEFCFVVDVKGSIEKLKTVASVAATTLAVEMLGTVISVGQTGTKLAEAFSEWQGRPRDPGCMAGAMALGSGGGFWAGGGFGSIGLTAGPAVIRRDLCPATKRNWS